MTGLAAPQLRLFCSLQVQIGEALVVGRGRFGQRRVIPITGGTVSGPGISGKVLPAGCDWQTINENGLTELGAQYAFETDDGAIIEVFNTGFRHAPEEVRQRMAEGEDVPNSEYYMRTSAKLETGHPDYQWVNGMMFVGTGGKGPDGVQIDLYAVE